MKIKNVLTLTLVLFLACISQAQTGSVLDKVVAIVGEEVILQSDVDNQYNYFIINGQKDDGSLRCQVMEQVLVSKLLLDKARQDSVEVSAPEVEGEIERRLRTIIGRMGGEKEFIEVYGKSVAQFRQDVREDIRNELLIERQRSILLAEAKVTPRDVRRFFNSLPKDSLGFFPAEVELNHILLKPQFDPVSKKEATEYLKNVRKDVVDEGLDFGLQAIEHSQGPSGARGGSLGEVRRGMMVPEFEEVLFSMREGEISDVFETEYGYHIVKLHKVRGQVREASHILRVPERSANADSLAMDSLRQILSYLGDSLSFEQAAIRFSEDRATKDCGGCMVNPKSGELRIPLDQLDPETYFKVDEMKEGEISEPMEYQLPDGSMAFHVLYIKRKIPPHRPNLKDDYKKIQSAALQLKQSEIFETWLNAARENIYIEIKPTECANALKSWTR
ncbi:MAG: peptidylprolyl isomerase [Bacteroidia bacterium]